MLANCINFVSVRLLRNTLLKTILFSGNQRISFLVSEYVEGELLTQYIKRQKGRRLHPFQALHLLHALAQGLENIHAVGEYHGDLHADNIIVQHVGLEYSLKIIGYVSME